MVAQKEFTTYMLNKINEDDYTCDVGDSTTANFDDGALDTVQDVVPTSGISTSIVDNKITHTIDVSSGIAAGFTIDANLLKINGTVPVNLVKYTSLAKTNDIVVQDIMTFEQLIQ